MALPSPYGQNTTNFIHRSGTPSPGGSPGLPAPGGLHWKGAAKPAEYYIDFFFLTINFPHPSLKLIYPTLSMLKNVEKLSYLQLSDWNERTQGQNLF